MANAYSPPPFILQHPSVSPSRPRTGSIGSPLRNMRRVGNEQRRTDEESFRESPRDFGFVESPRFSLVGEMPSSPAGLLFGMSEEGMAARRGLALEDLEGPKYLAKHFEVGPSLRILVGGREVVLDNISQLTDAQSPSDSFSSFKHIYSAIGSNGKEYIIKSYRAHLDSGNQKAFSDPRGSGLRQFGSKYKAYLKNEQSAFEDMDARGFKVAPLLEVVYEEGEPTSLFLVQEKKRNVIRDILEVHENPRDNHPDKGLLEANKTRIFQLLWSQWRDSFDQNGVPNFLPDFREGNIAIDVREGETLANVAQFESADLLSRLVWIDVQEEKSTDRSVLPKFEESWGIKKGELEKSLPEEFGFNGDWS